MNRLRPLLALGVLTLLPLSLDSAARATTYVVTNSPYNADNTGATDAAAAIQHAVNDAIAAGSGNTVSLPAGTYLIASEPITIQNSSSLTFAGAGTGSTMLWYTPAANNVFHVWNNSNVTVENFSADVAKISGQYDLGETQGTITAINTSTDVVTVQVESGYPLLSRSDIEGAPSGGGWRNPLYLLADPTRMDFSDSPTMTNVTPTGSGTTGTVTLSGLPGDIYVGEKWMIWGNGPGSIFLDAGYGNSGTTTFQNIDYYGGCVNYAMLDTNSPTGTMNFNSLYCGPPSYQSDRMQTVDEGWQMGGRAALNITNCTVIKTWDDTIDYGCGGTTTVSQPQSNQVIVSGTGDYEVNDSVEFCDDTTQPTGTYGQSTITGVSQTNGNTLLTLSQNVTIHNPTKDFFTDLSLAGAVTATNSTFNSCNGRHVYLKSGVSTKVTGCTFEYDTPLVPAGFDGGESPSDPRNVTITGNTFLYSAGVVIQSNGGSDTAPCGTNVTVSGNTFMNCGRYGEGDSEPLTVNNVTGATVSNNWFYNNWGANLRLNYDASATATGNVFMYPNQIQGWYSDDSSVIYLASVNGGTLSGNLVYGAGPYTNYLNENGGNLTSVSGMPDGTIDVDNPEAFYLNYDHLVMDQPSSGTSIDQATWTGGTSQKWACLPSQATPGYVTICDTSNGKYVGNGTSKTAGADLVQETQSWTSGVPTPEQLWNFAYFDDSNNLIGNDYSGYSFNVVGGSSSSGQLICQWYEGNYSNSKFYIVTPPTANAYSQFGTVTIGWAPVPYATSYSVGRSTTSGGPYTTIASGLTAGPYADASVINGTVYYYVVTAAGLPITDGQSNQVWAVPNGSYVPVNLAPAENVTGIEPDGWTYLGAGFDTDGTTYSAAQTGSYITWSGDLFSLGSPAKPDAIGDAGQRIILPGGNYSSLLMLGAYLGSGPTSTGTFQPTITYTNGSNTVLSQGMTNWCGTATQSGESNAATYSYRNYDNGGKGTTTNYIHAYSIPISSSLQPAWLTLPNTGNFRIMAMALGGANLSTLTVGENLLQGQYLISPNGNYILVQQSDGNLVLYNGPNTQHEGSAVWASGYYSTQGSYYTTLQSDGNLVTYAGTPSNKGAAVWAANDNESGITSLQLTNTPEVQVMQGSTVWWQRP